MNYFLEKLPYMSYNLLLLLTVLVGYASCNTNEQQLKKDTIIYKIHNKTGSLDTDTLWVSQNDSVTFKAEEGMQRNPGQKAKWVTRYELRNPMDGAYYFIYNDKHQLILEGKYTASYVYEGMTIENGNFYNSKSYYYKDNGRLNSIHYQVDGRNFKTELFNRKKELTEVIYFNKKSGDKEKEEIYKNGKLKETRIYTGFERYHTVKQSE